MNKKAFGAAAILSGSLLLAFELFCLKFMRLLSRSGGVYSYPSEWRNGPMGYLLETNVLVSVLIILGIIGWGVCVLYRENKKQA